MCIEPPFSHFCLSEIPRIDDGQHLMILPFTVYLDVLQRNSFLVETSFFQNPNRCIISRHDTRFNAVQRQLPKSIAYNQLYRFRGIAFIIMFLIEGISENCTLKRPPHHLHETDGSNQSICFIFEDSKAVSLV